MGRGLSYKQRCILSYFRNAEHAYAEAKFSNETSRTITRSMLRFWGVPSNDGIPRDPSERAALSRAMLRLEQRGLILRQNWTSGAPGVGGPRKAATDPHRKTTHVLLTDAGRALADNLAHGHADRDKNVTGRKRRPTGNRRKARKD